MKTLEQLTDELMVEVEAGDDCQDGPGIHFRLFGKLEKPEDKNGRYYLRIADTHSGCIGISFHELSVEEIHKKVYHWQITLKQHLNANKF